MRKNLGLICLLMLSGCGMAGEIDPVPGEQSESDPASVADTSSENADPSSDDELPAYDDDDATETPDEAGAEIPGEGETPQASVPGAQDSDSEDPTFTEDEAPVAESAPGDESRSLQPEDE